MLKRTNIILSIISCLMLFFLIFIYTKEDNLVTTRWYCDQSKVSFISSAYSKYNAFTEHMIVTFSSKESFMIREYVSVEEKNGDISPMEVFYEGKYKKGNGNLTLKFNRVRLFKRHSDDNVNESYTDYEGYSISYSYKQIDNKMYLYSMIKNDEFAMVCYKNKANK